MTILTTTEKFEFLSIESWCFMDHEQSRSQSPRYPRPAVGNEGLWDKAFTGKQESCDRSNYAGVRYSHIRFYQMELLFHEAVEFSMEKLGIKVLMKEQYDALLKSYHRKKYEDSKLVQHW